MPKQIAKQVKDGVVRLVLDHRDEYGSDYLACKAVAPKVRLMAWDVDRQVLVAQAPGLGKPDQM